MDQLTPRQNYEEFKWGVANDRRGTNRRMIDAAIAFAQAFPIGARPSVDDFDAWAHQKGLLNLPTGAPKQADVWKAHLQRRNELRAGINKCSAHPRMREYGIEPFCVQVVQHSSQRGTLPALLEVLPPQIAYARQSLPGRLDKLGRVYFTRLAHLLQSIDWTALPPHEKVRAEMVYEDLIAYLERMNMEADIYTRRMTKLDKQLRRIQPANPQLRLLSDEELEASDQGEDEPDSEPTS